MADLKLTKSELRLQQSKLTQLQKYLPTLQLKKAMLQAEVQEARLEISLLIEEQAHAQKVVEEFAGLLADTSVDLTGAAVVSRIKRRYENIAGVETPYFDAVDFADFSYQLFDTPPWTDTAIQKLRLAAVGQVKVDIAKEKKTALEKELRDVSTRVNLFEKILIPRALLNIKKIKVFLGDQQLAAVSQAKVAKAKIENRKALIPQVPHAY